MANPGHESRARCPCHPFCNSLILFDPGDSDEAASNSKEWDSAFQLHIPCQTVVESRIRDSKVIEPNVTLSWRRDGLMGCERNPAAGINLLGQQQ
jgi:hypothetical protein